MTTPSHWLLRVEDGVHFRSSQKYMRWGVNSKHTNCVPNFLRNVKPGDILWFIKNKSRGRVIGVATFTYHCPRILGPLIATTPTDEDLGWTKTHGEWDTEVHYKSLYDIDNIGILTQIQSPLVVRAYNPLKCQADLPDEYYKINKYSIARPIEDASSKLPCTFQIHRHELALECFPH